MSIHTYPYAYTYNLKILSTLSLVNVYLIVVSWLSVLFRVFSYLFYDITVVFFVKATDKLVPKVFN